MSRTEKREEEEEAAEGEAEAAAAKKPRVEEEGGGGEAVEVLDGSCVESIGVDGIRPRAFAGAALAPLRLAAAHAEDANVALREAAAAREVIVGVLERAARAMFLMNAESSIEQEKE